MPEGLDWEIWRIISSPRFSVPSPATILTEWSMEDLVDAHLVLDLFDLLEEKAAKA